MNPSSQNSSGDPVRWHKLAGLRCEATEKIDSYLSVRWTLIQIDAECIGIAGYVFRTSWIPGTLRFLDVSRLHCKCAILVKQEVYSINHA